MNHHLNVLYETLETERKQLLDLVAGLSPDQFLHAPEGKWSIGQILAHLVAAESLSVRYMNKKILGIENAGNTGIAEDLKMIILKVSQRLPFKFKAPASVKENTPTYSNFNELKSAWEMERIKLKELLAKFDDHQIRRKVYRHVRAGMLDVRQAVVFFREHNRHHVPQIRKLLPSRALE